MHSFQPASNQRPSSQSKKTSVSCLNDYHPVALTSAIMKCYRKLAINCIKSGLLTSVNPFAYHPHRYHILCTPDQPLLPGTWKHICEDTIYWLLFCVQHHHCAENGWEAGSARCEHLPCGTRSPKQFELALRPPAPSPRELWAPQGCALGPMLFTLMAHYGSATQL